MTEHELMNHLWDKVPGHDRHAHGGLALSQTGYVRGCKRCSLLRLPLRQFMRALQKYVGWAK